MNRNFLTAMTWTAVALTAVAVRGVILGFGFVAERAAASPLAQDFKDTRRVGPEGAFPRLGMPHADLRLVQLGVGQAAL